MNLYSVMRTIPDFPEPGIQFRDITTILKNGEAFREAVDWFIDQAKDFEFDYILGPESRGFIFGAPVAYHYGKGLVLVRKPGKLPAETVSVSYDLEYGSSTLEIHKDALKPGDKVLILDDLIATGGTCKAMCELVEKLGATVSGLFFLTELDDLKGRETLTGYEVRSLLHYQGE